MRGYVSTMKKQGHGVMETIKGSVARIVSQAIIRTSVH